MYDFIKPGGRKPGSTKFYQFPVSSTKPPTPNPIYHQIDSISQQQPAGWWSLHQPSSHWLNLPSQALIGGEAVVWRIDIVRFIPPARNYKINSIQPYAENTHYLYFLLRCIYIMYYVVFGNTKKIFWLHKYTNSYNNEKI